MGAADQRYGPVKLSVHGMVFQLLLSPDELGIPGSVQGQVLDSTSGTQKSMGSVCVIFLEVLSHSSALLERNLFSKKKKDQVAPFPLFYNKVGPVRVFICQLLVIPLRVG